MPTKIIGGSESKVTYTMGSFSRIIFAPVAVCALSSVISLYNGYKSCCQSGSKYQLSIVEQLLNKVNINLLPAYLGIGVSKRLSKNIIFEETFEGDDPLASVVNVQVGTPYGFSIVNNPVYSGSSSGRFELRASDPMVHRGKRSELFVINRISQNNKWYSFAVLFPSDGFFKDSSNELISQWHQEGSPPISLRTVNDKLYLRVLHDTQDDKWKIIDLAPITKDVWHKFVFHIVHSTEADGLIELWLNDEKILKYYGRNQVKGKKQPYWKVGVYKAKWNNSKTDTNLRVIYFDDIRVGNEFASYSEMTSTPKL